MTKTKFFYVVWALVAAMQLAACSGKKVDEGNPQDLFKDAEEDIHDKRY
ncbi:MAG: hypothetical protein HY075_14265, partial [Deltaproteobacteria bacterium]|nr:hypothetical protein [Deltaproteobacteria bacterium]